MAAAVILPPNFDFVARFPKLRFGDSKKLTIRQREATFEAIMAVAVDYQIALFDVPQIDNFGIGWVNKAIFVQLIEALPADRYIVDGNLKLPLTPDLAGRSVA